MAAQAKCRICYGNQDSHHSFKQAVIFKAEKTDPIGDTCSNNLDGNSETRPLAGVREQRMSQHQRLPGRHKSPPLEFIRGDLYRCRGCLLAGVAGRDFPVLPVTSPEDVGGRILGGDLDWRCDS